MSGSAEQSTQQQLAQPLSNNIVIIGGNFAGISAAQTLSRKISPQADEQAVDRVRVIVIDPRKSFNWTPNVHEVLSGVKQAFSVELDKEELLAGSLSQKEKREVDFICDTALHINTQDKLVTLGSGDLIPFGACILACGYQAPEKIRENHCFNFRTAQDAIAINETIEDLLNKDNPTHNSKINIAILGGGFTGIEVLGELLRKYQKTALLNIHLVEYQECLMPSMPHAVSDNIQKLCAEHNVNFYFNTYVEKTADNTLLLANGSQIEADIVIQTTGGNLPDIANDAGLVSMDDKSEQGIKVNASLQAAQEPSVFVAGDIASFPLEDGKVLAKQSYHATDMGKVAAINALNFLTGESLVDFEPVEKPVLLSFGDLNTYMALGESVIASPLLSATKESIYQVNLLKLSTNQALIQQGVGAASRLLSSVEQLLLPEICPTTPFKIAARTRVLQCGKSTDLRYLLQGASATVFEGWS